MAYYSIAMLTLAATLAERDSVYDDMVVKFLEQMVLIMDALEGSGCYDHEDGFFYDLLTTPSGVREPVRVQTLVGVIPALPALTLQTQNTERVQRLERIGWSASGCPGRMAGARSTAVSSSCRAILPGRTICCSLSTSTATTARDLEQCIRPVGPR
jgi:hypothetical protein